jgi:hypothetical protein
MNGSGGERLLLGLPERTTRRRDVEGLPACEGGGTAAMTAHSHEAHRGAAAVRAAQISFASRFAHAESKKAPGIHLGLGQRVAAVPHRGYQSILKGSFNVRNKQAERTAASTAAQRERRRRKRQQRSAALDVDAPHEVDGEGAEPPHLAELVVSCAGLGGAAAAAGGGQVALSVRAKLLVRRGVRWEEHGATEITQDGANPGFCKSFLMSWHPGTGVSAGTDVGMAPPHDHSRGRGGLGSRCRIELHARWGGRAAEGAVRGGKFPGAAETLLGACEFWLAVLMRSDSRCVAVKLGDGGQLAVRGVPVRRRRRVDDRKGDGPRGLWPPPHRAHVTIAMQVVGLGPASSASYFFTILRQIEAGGTSFGEHELVARAEAAPSVRQPSATVQLSAHKLCFGDERVPVLLRLHRHAASGYHEHVGSVRFVPQHVLSTPHSSARLTLRDERGQGVGAVQITLAYPKRTAGQGRGVRGVDMPAPPPSTGHGGEQGAGDRHFLRAMLRDAMVQRTDCQEDVLAGLDFLAERNQRLQEFRMWEQQMKDADVKRRPPSRADARGQLGSAGRRLFDETAKSRDCRLFLHPGK